MSTVAFGLSVIFGILSFYAYLNINFIQEQMFHLTQPEFSCTTNTEIVFYRYANYQKVQNISTCASLNEIIDLARTIYNDTRITRVVDFHGFPVETTQRAFEKGEIIFLDHEERFMFPTRHIGYSTEIDLDGRHIKLTTASLAPRLYIVEGFLTDEEADYAVEHVKKKEMEKSKIGETAEVSVYDNVIRTSSNTWVGPLTQSRDPVFDRLQSRVLNFTHMPDDLAEDIQVVHYGVGEHFYVHHDYNDPGSCQTGYCRGGGNRYLTFLFYLNNVTSGGETTFPYFGAPNDPLKDPIPYSAKCGEGGLRVKPKKGMAVLFYNLKEQNHMNNNVDPTSLHSGCDVIVGEKWAANLWVRNKRVNGKLIDDNW